MGDLSLTYASLVAVIVAEFQTLELSSNIFQTFLIVSWHDGIFYADVYPIYEVASGFYLL